MFHTPTRRRFGALGALVSLGFAFSVSSASAAGATPGEGAGGFAGACTESAGGGGSCVIDEPEGNNPALHGTAIYERDGDFLTFILAPTANVTEIQACVTVDDGGSNPYVPTNANTCAGQSPDRVYEGPGTNPLVLDLTTVDGYDAGDAVFFTLHIVQGGLTTYVVGGSTPDACPELDGDQMAGEDCTPDACPELDGDQMAGEDCTRDACPELEGDQMAGEDCTPDPVDACPELDGMQQPGDDCTPDPVDACPDLDGMQQLGDECVLGTTVDPPSPTVAGPPAAFRAPAVSPTAVLGATQTRPAALARTGLDTSGLLALAAFLLAAGTSFARRSKVRLA